MSCEVSRRCVLQGVWPQWSGCLQGMSSTYDESLSGCGRVPVKGVSPVVPVELKRPSACSPVLPVNGLLEQDQSPCGRGSIVVLCTKRDCRLVVLSERRFCSRRCGKEAQLVLLPVERVCELQTRLACSGSSSPTSWKRGSPLAPVVGEGQVNLVFRPAVKPAGAMGKVSKALWLS